MQKYFFFLYYTILYVLFRNYSHILSVVRQGYNLSSLITARLRPRTPKLVCLAVAKRYISFLSIH